MNKIKVAIIAVLVVGIAGTTTMLASDVFVGIDDEGVPVEGVDGNFYTVEVDEDEVNAGGDIFEQTLVFDENGKRIEDQEVVGVGYNGVSKTFINPATGEKAEAFIGYTNDDKFEAGYISTEYTAEKDANGNITAEAFAATEVHLTEEGFNKALSDLFGTEMTFDDIESIDQF